MDKSMAVLGTGAIGSSIGADLTKAGYNVQLFDQWPAHVEAMKARGLTVNMRGEKFQVPVKAFHLCDLANLKPQFDIVFLAVKSYDSCWMAELIKPYLKSDGVLVSTQNSFNDEWIAPIIGAERDIGCVVELSAEVFDPGIVKRNTTHTTTFLAVGELDGRITPRVKEIADILRSVARVEVTNKIWRAKWTKFVFNMESMAVYSAAGVSLWQLTKHPKILEFCVKVGREIMQVCNSLGYGLEPLFGLSKENAANVTDDVLRSLMLGVRSDLAGETHSCMLQDILKGRRTEIDQFNGLVVKKGRKANIPTPLNEAIVAMIKRMEQERLEPSMSNLDMLKKYM